MRTRFVATWIKSLGEPDEVGDFDPGNVVYGSKPFDSFDAAKAHAVRKGKICEWAYVYEEDEHYAGGVPYWDEIESHCVGN